MARQKIKITKKTTKKYARRKSSQKKCSKCSRYM